jgi:hypothetical protein
MNPALPAVVVTSPACCRLDPAKSTMPAIAALPALRGRDPDSAGNRVAAPLRASRRGIKLKLPRANLTALKA